MKAFIILQHKIYITGGQSIGIDRIKQLARRYLSPEEYSEMFGGDGNG